VFVVVEQDLNLLLSIHDSSRLGEAGHQPLD